MYQNIIILQEKIFITIFLSNKKNINNLIFVKNNIKKIKL